MNLSPLPIQKFFDNNGRPLNGGLLYTYVAGTTTKIATYTDSSGVTQNTNPVVLDYRGEARVWLDPELTYKFVLAPVGDTDPPTRPIWTVDNIQPGVTFTDLTRQIIGEILFPQTPEEVAGGVMPIYFYYEAPDIRRWGADPSGALDSVPAIHMGWQAYNFVSAAEGTYKIDQPITPVGNKTFSGPCGGTQSAQAVTLNHTGAGLLWDSSTNQFGGVCFQNFAIIGGNGGYAIKNGRPQSVFRNLHAETYDGGFIDLDDGVDGTTAPGSWACLIEDCKWVAPATQTAYRGINYSVNGGNTVVRRFTAIRGSIGAYCQQGEAIVFEQCSFNQQNSLYSSESASVGQCGIKFARNYSVGPPIKYYKQALTLRENYFEACSNNLWFDSCQSALVEGNYFDDNSAGGPNITIGAEANNVTIRNNHMLFRFTGGVVNNIYNTGTNTRVEDNDIELSDTSPPTAYWLQTTTKVYYGNNRVIDSARVPITYDGILDPNKVAFDTVQTDGTWTPVVAGSGTAGTQTYSLQFGRYTRIGRRINFDFVVIMSAKDGATAGNFTITGLPFTSRNDASRVYNVALGAYGGIDLTAGKTQAGGTIGVNSGVITMFESGDNVALAALTAASITATTTVYGSGSYEI